MQMAKLCFSLLLLLQLCMQPAASHSTVKFLPGFQGPLPFELETGYVGVGESEEAQLFYYFVKSDKNPKEDPLLLWLTGGPGCSAFSGLAYEIGPVNFNTVEYNGSLPTLRLNPYSWTKEASILFVDSPVGTGFSYARTPHASQTGDFKQVHHLDQFLRKWLMDHPEFISNPFYVGGDSYSGITVPALVQRISNENEEDIKPLINLQGYILGNPRTDMVVEQNSQIPFAHGMGLISNELYESLKITCGGEYVNVDPNNKDCLNDIQTFSKLTSGVEKSHILEPHCQFFSPKPRASSHNRRSLNVNEQSQEFLNPEPTFPPIGCRSYGYLLARYWDNDHNVRKALHIRQGSKAAALALAVKAGSVLEEEHERGVAHIVEHLAFSATEKYTNHDIIKFLESIGAEFGACQNAVTSADETVYELFVPVDKPELLSRAISVLAEFSTEVRVSKDDLEKERGAVLEEYRGNRNASGRMQDAHWVLMMEGSKYAECLPIGLEKVIRTVSSDTVKRFYQKWYRLQNMAVIAVGDFPDTKGVVELINTHFGQKKSATDPPVIPKFPVPSHQEPRFSCFIESEAGGSAVIVSYKMPVNELKTIKDYKEMLTESMFLHALNQRFFKLSRRKDPPYFSCSASADDLVRPLKAYIMSSSCKERGTLKALESMLIEVARVRLHGFSEREVSVARALLMSEVESAYLERDQMQSTNLRDECLQHFLCKEPIIGIEYEARLQKTLLPHISALEVSRYSEKLQTSCSCVIKTIEPQTFSTIDDLKNIVLKIKNLEEKNISPWDEENIPEEIVSTKPSPGNIVQQFEYENLGATELVLSNGMRVCYKCTDFLDDQVLFTGFSYGGLSELPESEYLSCSMGSTIAGEIGVFGYRPSMLMDMLAGKRVEGGTKVGAYMRTFSGDCSPSDLETALQLVYQLFTTNVAPGEEEVEIVMQMAEEVIRAQERDPYTAFANRVKEINYGNSYFFRPIRISDLQKVDPLKACDYFNSCFKDPSTFTVVIVGNIDPSNGIPLILQYLGGIPKPPEPILHFNRDNLKGLPFTFPSSIIREVVRSPMVEAQCSVQLCFPVELKNGTMVEEINYVGFLSKLLETKMMQVLRFKHGQIYSASVSVFLGGNKHSRTGDVRGDISINFSCDPEISFKLVDLALDEISRLQKEGPSDEDVSTILELEQRAHETGLQENYHWLDRILCSYQSRVYSGDVGTSFKIQDEARSKVRKSLQPLTLQLALQRIMPYPCNKQFTVVILMPQVSRFKFLRSLFRHNQTYHLGDAKALAAVAGLTFLAFSLWRYSRRTLKS